MRLAAEGYRVYNADLPGHGHAPPPPEPWGVPEHAALVRRFIASTVLRKRAALQGGVASDEGAVSTHPSPAETSGGVTIIGHSNGGRIALYMASDPEMAPLVRRLVLISPSGVAPERSAKTRWKANLAKALKTPFGWLPPGRLRDFGLDWLRHSLLWKALGSADYRALSGTMRETFVKTVNHHHSAERLARITAPTLLLWGDADPAISRRQMAVLEGALPDAGLVVLEGAGHYGYLDDPDTFFAATTYFLEHS